MLRPIGTRFVNESYSEDRGNHQYGNTYDCIPRSEHYFRATFEVIAHDKDKFGRLCEVIKPIED